MNILYYVAGKKNEAWKALDILPATLIYTSAAEFDCLPPSLPQIGPGFVTRL